MNIQEVSLQLHGGRRLMHIHENRPGVLTALNKIFAEQGVNIAAHYLQTSAQMGYVVIDIEADEDVAEKALQAMKAIPGTIRARPEKALQAMKAIPGTIRARLLY